MAFTKVCKIEDIIPGTGVCALLVVVVVASAQRKPKKCSPYSTPDPFFPIKRFIRGLTVEHKVSFGWLSPLKKQRFNLLQQVWCTRTSA
ncbi:nitrite reductase (NAD(P)H) small subunit [Vibrio lentus]|nr:nitrite reductase (NAD(P)H) small subunit [Vibrio lentus]